jgi:hypothetical protein
MVAMTNDFTPPYELVVLARLIIDMNEELGGLSEKRERMLELYNLTVERLKQEHDVRVTNTDL